MLTIPAGSAVIELIELAHAADQPVMLVGRHGIGKSSLFEAAAERLGIGLIVRDLSLMEPVDLVGIPRVDPDGRTVYAPPAFLPTEGAGLFVLEELNRAPRYVQVPALQLLTARRLNDFVFPPRWLPCAAINDGEEYQVDLLDPALLSRFLRVRIEAAVTAWLEWARSRGNIHDRVAAFVEQAPDVFKDPDANPRAWTYASNLLRQWEAAAQNQDLLATALAGVLGEQWAVAFLQFYGVGSARPLTASQIIHSYGAHRHMVRQWLRAGQLDLVVASLEVLKRHLQRQADYQAATDTPKNKRNLEQFFSDLPGDIKRLLRAWLKERGFDGLKVARKVRP
jgi:hypothetical protein